MLRYSVPGDLDRKRLDVVLAAHPQISSRAEAQRHIQAGVVSVNESDTKISPRRIVKAGDIISFTLLSQPETDVVAVPFPLEIHFEDDHLLIVNKPRGVVVHPAAGHQTDTLVNYLLHHTTLSGVDPVRPGIVHRLDKDTSGLLVVAKDKATHEQLARQFHDHSVLRVYQAIVWGVPKTAGDVIDKPLGRHPKNRKKYTTRENGKQAVTHWTLEKPYRHLSLIRCRLETGRTHQIRVHMSSIGHPLLGDSLYGSFRSIAGTFPPKLRSLLKACDGQALHAGSLGFSHPKSGEWIERHIGLPNELTDILAALEGAFG